MRSDFQRVYTGKKLHLSRNIMVILHTKAVEHWIPKFLVSISLTPFRGKFYLSQATDWKRLVVIRIGFDSNYYKPLWASNKFIMMMQPVQSNYSIIYRTVIMCQLSSCQICHMFQKHPYLLTHFFVGKNLHKS